jgi:hypothetical protein
MPCRFCLGPTVAPELSMSMRIRPICKSLHTYKYGGGSGAHLSSMASEPAFLKSKKQEALKPGKDVAFQSACTGTHGHGFHHRCRIRTHHRQSSDSTMTAPSDDANERDEAVVPSISERSKPHLVRDGSARCSTYVDIKVCW